MTINEVPFDGKNNDRLFLNKIKEKLNNGKISLSEYRYQLKQIPSNKPQPIAMEHIYFPLGLLLAGIILSAIFLLAEIIIKRLDTRLSSTELY